MPGVLELRRIMRRLCRHPLSAGAIVLVLALGIAISVAMYSVLRSVVLRSLPYPSGERIVTIHAENSTQGQMLSQLTAMEATEALEQVPGFDATAYYGWGAFTFTGDGSSRLIETSFVSADYFEVFGLTAALGRTLNAEDVAQERAVAVLNHDAWIQLTGGDANAIGQTLRFQSSQFELVGVLPESFDHPKTGPLMYRPMLSAIVSRENPGYKDERLFSAIGRLSQSVSGAVANEGLRDRQIVAAEAHGISDLGGWRLYQRTLIDGLIGNARGTLFALFAVTLFVLLVACSTAGSLASIRFEMRDKEIAVRRSLGASDLRIAIDVLAELILLVSGAAGAGLLLASLSLKGLAPFLNATLPRSESIAIDSSTVVFALAATLATVLLTSVAPVRRALLGASASKLRAGTSREVDGIRRSVFVTAIGVGLATAALVSAFALMASLVRLGNVLPGFRTANVAAVQIFRSVPDVYQFTERAFAELRTVPGVRDVSAVRSPPLDSGARFATNVAPSNAIQDAVSADVQRAAPGYHRFLRISILRGRDISDADRADAPKVGIVNQALARRVFGDRDPVGQQLVVFLNGEAVSLEVIGIAQDTRNVGLRTPTNPELVVPMAQLPQWPWSVTLLVESAIPPLDIMRALEAAIRRVDAEQAIYRSFALGDELASQTRQARFFAGMSSAFALLALLLGLLGVHAVIAAMVARRRREIGVRVALGAAPRQASMLVFATAARVVGYGIGVGALLALPVLAVLRKELYGFGVQLLTVSFAATAFSLLIAGFAASARSAWRASRVAPMDALRAD